MQPIALGCKNSLVAGAESASKRAVAVMSLLAAAKANDNEIYAWLPDALTVCRLR